MAQGKSLDEIVQEHIGSGRVALPVFDQTSLRIREMIERKIFDPAAVERLVATDPVLASSLLRHANSSFFGGIDKVLTVRDAIIRLGVKQVAELVILSSQREQYRLADASLRKLAGALWRHAVGCGIGSQWLARRLDLGENVQKAFLAGLLHDIGKLLLVRVLDDLIAKGRLRFRPSEPLMLQLLDGLHCQQGHALMKSWNLPDEYAAVVRDHHQDRIAEHDVLLALVRLVDTACNRLGIGLRGRIDVSLAATPEAQYLRASEVLLAELEIRLEDAMQLAE